MKKCEYETQLENLQKFTLEYPIYHDFGLNTSVSANLWLSSDVLVTDKQTTMTRDPNGDPLLNPWQDRLMIAIVLIPAVTPTPSPFLGVTISGTRVPYAMKGLELFRTNSLLWDYTSNNVETEPCEPNGTFLGYFLPAALTIVFLLDLIGNGLVLMILMSRRTSWHLADYYLFQLALSDLLLGVTLPFWAVQYGYGWSFGQVPCKILGALFTINMYSSILLLVCISLSRYFSIVHAVELHKKQHRNHTIVICVFVWGLSCFLSWHEFYYRAVDNPLTDKLICNYKFDPEKSNSLRIALQLTELTIAFIAPLILMLFFYSRIFCTLQGSRLNHSRRSQVVIVVLLLVFFFCWAPYKSFLLIDTLQRMGYISRNCQFEKMLDIGLVVSEALGLSHVCINPIIYAFVGVKFRKEILRVFKKLSDRVVNSSMVLSREGTIFTDSNPSYSKIM
ncbi:C-X-C chemokine receptor type 3-2-like [Leptodactylus fuscus]|uniref:C-X-C chemokine receptor type 3-2-like n=1 Tax=Leptodactylus fuscus TaxID=238119 RepID=UPI003F4ED76F